MVQLPTREQWPQPWPLALERSKLGCEMVQSPTREQCHRSDQWSWGDQNLVVRWYSHPRGISDHSSDQWSWGDKNLVVRWCSQARGNSDHSSDQWSWRDQNRAVRWYSHPRGNSATEVTSGFGEIKPGCEVVKSPMREQWPQQWPMVLGRSKLGCEMVQSPTREQCHTSDQWSWGDQNRAVRKAATVMEDEHEPRTVWQGCWCDVSFFTVCVWVPQHCRVSRWINSDLGVMSSTVLKYKFGGPGTL